MDAGDGAVAMAAAAAAAVAAVPDAAQRDAPISSPHPLPHLECAIVPLLVRSSRVHAAHRTIVARAEGGDDVACLSQSSSRRWKGQWRALLAVALLSPRRKKKLSPPRVNA